MKYYKLITDPDIDFQVIENENCDDLIKKGLYEPYINKSISCLELDKGVKTTDVLSIGTSSLKGHIIKNNVYDIFKLQNNHEIQYVNITNGGLEDYKFMFFNGDLTNYIDYEKSDFRVVKKGLLKTKILDIDVPKNRDDVLRIDIEECSDSIFNELIAVNGYHFLPDFDLLQYDVFRIGHYDLNFYISGQVKEVLQKNNVTGVEYVEVDFGTMLAVDS